MVSTAILEAAKGPESTRKILEAAFLSELAQATDFKIPLDFRDIFTSDDSAPGGWYNIVALNISEAIATNGRFRSLLFHAELVDIKALALEAKVRIMELQSKGVPSISGEVAYVRGDFKSDTLRVRHFGK